VPDATVKEFEVALRLPIGILTSRLFMETIFGNNVGKLYQYVALCFKDEATLAETVLSHPQLLRVLPRAMRYDEYFLRRILTNTGCFNYVCRKIKIDPELLESIGQYPVMSSRRLGYSNGLLVFGDYQSDHEYMLNFRAPKNARIFGSHILAYMLSKI